MYYQVQTISPGVQGNPAENFHLVPKVDVLESSDEVIYIFEMPGIEEKSVNVEVKDNMLFVGGDIIVGVENEALNILYQERENIRSYSRFLSLPPDADSEQAAANVRNGLLTIRFPKKKIGRRLPINQHQTQFQQAAAQNSYNQVPNNQVPNLQNINIQQDQFQQQQPQNVQQHSSSELPQNVQYHSQ